MCARSPVDELHNVEHFCYCRYFDLFHMDTSKSSKVTFLRVPSRAENKLCGESFKGSGKLFVVTSIRYQEVGSPHYQTLPLGADGEEGGGEIVLTPPFL